MTPGISLPHLKWRIDAEEVTNGGKMIDVPWPELRSRGLGDRGTVSTQRRRCRAEPREVKSRYNNKDVKGH